MVPRDDRRAAEADFGLVGEDRHRALDEIGQELFELREGADGESVKTALDRMLIGAGWPARQHVVGSIKTRRMVADVDGASTSSELSALLRRGLIELASHRLDRLNGRPSAALDPIFAPDAVQPVAGEGSAGLTLDDLAKRFLAERAPTMLAKTLTEYEALARVLKEVWGEALPVREIDRDRCRQIRDLFATLPSNWAKRFPRMTTMEAAEHAKANGIAPMDPTTANKHVSRLSTMLRWAEREDFIAKNHAAGLKVAKPQSDIRDARRRFSIDQLKAIFAAPLYTGCKDDQAGYMVPGPNVIRRGRFWLPLLALYTGCRMGELCQLRTDDIEIEHGVHVLQIRPDPEAGTRLKTQHSRRTVPIHPELIRCGFLDFVTRQRKAGTGSLVPRATRRPPWVLRRPLPALGQLVPRSRGGQGRPPELSQLQAHVHRCSPPGRGHGRGHRRHARVDPWQHARPVRQRSVGAHARRGDEPGRVSGP